MGNSSELRPPLRARRWLAVIGAGAALLSVSLAGAHGQGVREYSSPWEETPYSQARLVAGSGGAAKGAPRYVGVEIRLRANWKTYWRQPGEAGLPPEFDFSGSGNLAGATVLWPAPSWYVDEYGEAIGYKDRVIFPVRVTAEDPGRPITIRLNLSYAVCLDICVPVQTDLSLDVAGQPASSSSPHAADINRFKALVPERAGRGAEKGIKRVLIRGEGKTARLVVELADGSAKGRADIFVEGPQEYYFGPPAPEETASGASVRYAIPIDGLSDNSALTGKSVTLTLVHGDKRLQQDWVLK